jgi:NAD(P)H-hydrate epimerase
VGQVIQPGVQYVGRLEVIDIGIPPEVVKAVGISQVLLAPEVVGAWLPERSPEGHKGTFGHLMIVAGSVGKSGAALLSGKGALRSGVGLVTLCAPKRLADIFSASLIEAMTLPLTESDGFFSGKDMDAIIQEAAKRSALVLGPGLGMAPETGELVAGLYRKLAIPMVIDADGLNLLARNPSLLKNPPGPRIFTPHPGEMARLSGLSTSEVQQDRVKAAREFASRYKLTLVLKGASTVVAGADGNIAVNSTGNPGMATGGMGDVLAGLLGGLLAQGISPWKAACLGVFVHGLAADRLVETEGMPFGYLASEVAAELPRAFGRLSAED